MNILPLVLTFLLIFSCIAASFLKETKSYAVIESTLHGYSRTEMALNNAIARAAYHKMKGELLEKGTREQDRLAAKSEYKSRRCFFPALENSKLNLAPIFQGSEPFKTHPLYEPSANLLRLLYRRNLFKKQENLEYRLLDEMLKKAKRLGTVGDLAELFPEDPSLKNTYYRMLVGTNQFDEKQGIAPLREFLSIQNTDKAVCISFASVPVLKALFGPDIASLILKVEQEQSATLNKYYYFNKQDLEAALVKTPALTALGPYLDYSKQFTPRKQWGGRDTITGIGVVREKYTLRE